GSEGIMPFFSAGLHYNVVAGELAGQPTPSNADLEAAEASLFVSSAQIAGYGAALQLWPAYPHDRLFGTYADTDKPLLMLASPLDAQTTIGPAPALASHYTKPNQSFVVIERGSHGLIDQSPTPSGVDCGLSLVSQFLNAPTAPLDVACLEEVLP